MKTSLAFLIRPRTYSVGTLAAALSLALATTVTNLSQAQTPVPILTQLWSLGTGVAPYMTTGTTERGIGINPVTTNIILISRAGAAGTYVKVLNGTNGDYMADMLMTGVSGGTFALSHVKVADDGVIYSANLSGSATAQAVSYKIYRWDGEDLTGSVAPTTAWAGIPGPGFGRYGDSFDVRGAGAGTQIIASGSANTNIAIFTTLDGTNFTSTEFSLTAAGIAAGAAAKAVTFYTNDTFICKDTGNPDVRIVGFNLATTNLTLLATLPTSTFENGGCALAFNANDGTLAYVRGDNSSTAGTQRYKVFDMSTATPTVLLDTTFPLPQTANGNSTGAADSKAGLYAGLDTQNGIFVYQVTGYANNNPPSIATQPQDRTNVLAGGYTTMFIAAGGTAPLKYQWKFNDVNVTGATNDTLVFTNLTAAAIGQYSVAITNNYGFAISSNAALDLLPSVLTTESAKLWQLIPGSRSYITADNTQRGMAFNALSNHVLIASRAGTPSINVIDAATGANVTSLDMTSVGGQVGETFPINGIGVAEDGAVYVCNLANTGSGGSFTIYRWADSNPATVSTIAYGPDNPAGARIGDTFAVTGSGVNTKLIAATRSGTVVIVFTTADGVNFSANPVNVSTGPNPAPAGFAGLGLAAGDGDTFWATAGTFLLRKVVYDIPNGTNDVLLALGGQTGNNIGVDTVNEFVATVGTGDTPSNVRMLDVRGATTAAVLVDQEFFGSDNDNINGTGAVAFDVAGGRVFALDSNNGLIALKYAPRVKQNGNTLTWTGPGALQSAIGVGGNYNDVTGATSPYVTNTTGAVFFRVRR